MFYSLAVILLIILIFGFSANKSSSKRALILMLIFYWLTLLFIFLYLGKHLYYYTVLTQYLSMSKIVWRYLYYLNIDRILLVRLCNLSELGLIYTSIHFSLLNINLMNTRTKSKIRKFTFLYLILVLMLHDPSINIKIYYALIPNRVSPITYRHIESAVNLFSRSLNNVLIVGSSLLMLFSTNKLPQIKKIRYAQIFLSASYLSLSLIHVFFLSILPANFLNISKISNSYFFVPLILPFPAFAYRVLPAFLLLFSIFLLISTYLINITNQQLLDRELSIKRQIDASTITSSVINHYVKNELVAIQSAIEEIGTITNNPELVQEALGRTTFLFARLDEMNRAFSTSSELELGIHDLRDVVEKCLASFKQKLENIDTQLILPEQPVYIMIDEDYMELALYNIIQNAIDAFVTIEDRQPQLIIQLQETNSSFFLSITDNGSGMDDSELSRIFIPYYSSRPVSKNWGIGLSHTFNIIKAHNGKIDVRSKVGSGSVFRIELPKLYKDG